MTISKTHIQVSTINAVVALILGIGAVFAIFYNTKADIVAAQTNLDTRVVKLETIMPEVRDAIKEIKDGQAEQKSFYYSQILPTLQQLKK